MIKEALVGSLVFLVLTELVEQVCCLLLRACFDRQCDRDGVSWLS